MSPRFIYIYILYLLYYIHLYMHIIYAQSLHQRQPPFQLSAVLQRVEDEGVGASTITGMARSVGTQHISK